MARKLPKRRRDRKPRISGKGQLRRDLLAAQAQLHRTRSAALVVILTGMPSAGRSEIVNELLAWLDPKHVCVHAYGAPDRFERSRPPLWRYWRRIPPRGRIAFLFAGWYVEPMTPEDGLAPPARGRVLERIRQLERLLRSERVRVLKVHLSIDAHTQRRRMARLAADPLTRWRITSEDRWLAKHHETVAREARRCIEATDRDEAPWHCIDATDESARLLAVAQLLNDELRAGLRMKAPRAEPLAPPPNGAVRAAPRAPAMQKAEYRHELEILQGRLARLVRRSRFRRHALVLVFEGMDAAGKGGAIRRVTQALDAREYQVVPVSAPTTQELEYPYLWRFWRDVPRYGRIAMFDRSWYGRVLVERVRGYTPVADWQRAYAEIVELERQLVEHGIGVVKFWLDVSQQEQLRRLRAREENPLKRYKADPEDWVNRRYYESYRQAADDMIDRTSAREAPWIRIAGDDKRRARLAVLTGVCERLERLLS